MEMENNYASKGVGGTALGLSIGALGAELLGGTFNNILGGCNGNGNYSRYDAEKDARIANLETEIKLRDANFYSLSEVGKLRDYMEHRFDKVEHEIAEQHTYNAVNTSVLNCVKGDVEALMNLTKVIIPASSICPPVMPQYNSWVAPTTTG